MKFVKVLENYVSQQNLDSLVFRELPTNKHLKYLKTDNAKFKDFNVERFYQYFPPKNSSLETFHEIKEIQKLDRDDRFIDTTDDIHDHFKELDGIEYDEEKWKKLSNEVLPIIFKLKYKFNRPRPLAVAERLGIGLDTIYLKSAQTPSYPSGHSLQGRLISLCLADEYPEMASEILQRGLEIGKGRLMAKVHYPSDHEFAVLVADEIYRYMQSDNYIAEAAINEIGDASAKKFKYKGPSSRQILQILDKEFNDRKDQNWSEQKAMNWEFSTENADYVVNIDYSVNAHIRLNLGRRKPGTTPRRRKLNASLGFSVKADKREDRERVTNFGEHFRVLATVCDIFVDFINTVHDDYILNKVYMIPKAENDETEDTDNQRGRFYEAFIKKQIGRIKGKVTVQNTTIKTDDGATVGGFVLIDGHQYTMGGKRHKEFRNEQFNEAKSRDPRKKGEHKGSSSHSDLYTDEDPKGTIHGLGFKDAQKAEDSIKIIKKADREHAHKVQATLVMQQRAKVAIERTKDPEKKKNLKAAYEIWTKFLEEMKEKTKRLNKE